jgi:hypothetical protein
VTGIRAANVAHEISSFVESKHDEWRKERRRRKEERLPDVGPALRTQAIKEIHAFIKRASDRAELPIDRDQIQMIIDAALAGGRNGRFDRIASAMYAAKVTPVKSRTSQTLHSVLSGRKQRAGKIAIPEQGWHVHDFTPLSPTYVLQYIVRHAHTAMRGSAAEIVLSWDEASQRAWLASELRRIADNLTTSSRPPQTESSSPP